MSESKQAAAAAAPVADAVAQVLADAPATLRGVVDVILGHVRRADPGVVLLAWPRQRIVSCGTGPRKMTDHYAYVGLFAAHVNLGFYRGTSLPDPTGLLAGTGKALRHVQLRTPEEANGSAVLALLHAAIAERRRHAGVPAR